MKMTTYKCEQLDTELPWMGVSLGSAYLLSICLPWSIADTLEVYQ